MQKTFSLLAPCFAVIFLSGCNGAFLGNLVVLAMTLGIFFGTLALGRSSTATASEASSSTQSTGPS